MKTIAGSVRGLIFFTVKLAMVWAAVMIAGVLLIGSFFNSAVRSGESAMREFAVEGVAKQKVVPDSARINLGKTLVGTDAAALQTTASSSINKLQTALKRLGLKEEQLRTSNYMVEPVADKDGNINSYRVRISLEVDLEASKPDSELLNGIVTAGKDSGVNEVQNFYFYLSNYESLKQELEGKAVQNAQQLADKRSRETGLRLGRVKTVNYGGNYYPYANDGLRSSAAEVDKGGVAMPAPTNSSNLSFQPGQFDLETRVTVVYEIL